MTFSLNKIRTKVRHFIASKLRKYSESILFKGSKIVKLAPKTSMLDPAVLKSMKADPRFNSIIDDLIAFTGLAEEQVLERLIRTPQTHFKSEFRWRSPKSVEELTWFYRCSEGYLFGNASHPYWKRLDFLKPEHGPILDYAAGAGNNVISLANKGVKIDCLEIGIIQEAFLRFRVKRKRLTNIRIISSYNDGAINPVQCITDEYGAIILQDVLEHIPNYHILLRYLIDHLRPKGYIVESSPLKFSGNDIDIHLKQKMPMEVAMIGMHKIEENIWQKVTE